MNTFKRIDPSLTENTEKKDRQSDRKENCENNKSGWKIIRKSHPVILKRLIEKLHKTSFRRLGKLSRKKMSVLRKLNIIKSKFPTKNQG